MYSLKGVLDKSPSTIKGALLAVLTALVVSGVIDVSAEAAVAWGLVIERFLELFVVAPRVTNTAALKEWDEALQNEVPDADVAVVEAYDSSVTLPEGVGVPAE